MDFETNKIRRFSTSRTLYKFDPMDFETSFNFSIFKNCIQYKFDPMDFETKRICVDLKNSKV